MTYTFLHSGIVMGESDLADKRRHARQRGGLFLPTEYGRTLLPRITCVLSAGRQLRTQLASLGGSIESLRGEQLQSLLESASGQAMLDLGRVLSEVELRASDGRRLEFKQIAFVDLHEWQRAGHITAHQHEATRAASGPGTDAFMVSVTLRRKLPRLPFGRVKPGGPLLGGAHAEVSPLGPSPLGHPPLRGYIH